jgi:hypothetical protein
MDEGTAKFFETELWLTPYVVILLYLGNRYCDLGTINLMINNG